MNRTVWIWTVALLAARLAAGQAGALPHWPRLEGGGAYVFFQSKVVILVNGTARELARARARQAKPDESLFWFERLRKEYVVRDVATLKQLQLVFAPVMQLGQQQAALAARQEQLGREQNAVEAQQSDLMSQAAAAGERMASLAAEQVVLQGDNADTSAVEAEMRAVEQEQQQLELPQTELANRREGLFSQQQWMARQLADLAKQQAEATLQAEARLGSLLSKALAAGTAKALQ